MVLVPHLVVREDVAEAVQLGRPVVALESTLIAHGLPWPLNLETAQAAEAAVREEGAVPATIAVVDGRPAEPVVAIEGAGPEDGPGMAEVPCVVITAVKAADDGSGDLIVRYHEAAGGRARFRLTFPAHYTTATTCDLLEVGHDTGALDVVVDDARRYVERELRPFQIETLRLALDPDLRDNR